MDPALLAGAAAATFLAYLCGSMSTAILVCRLWRLPDPRSQGSGNPGATNVLRIGGRLPALVTLLGDFLKGYLPVATAVLLGAPAGIVAAVLLAAFAGHLYPLFFGFQGGKGVATALGVNAGLSVWMGLAVGGTWLLTAALARISSVASLITAALSPLFVWVILAEPAITAAVAVMTLVQFWTHRDNLRNLAAGREPRIGSAARGESPPDSRTTQ